jgi:hypothetical protein
MDLKVLRKIENLDEAVISFIENQDGFYGPNNDYVDNDHPRDTFVTEDLLKATVCFAVADGDGNIISDNIPTLVEAERLKNSAEVTFNVKVTLPPSAPAASVPAGE